jgi:hypothetical protein
MSAEIGSVRELLAAAGAELKISLIYIGWMRLIRNYTMTNR